MLPGLPLFLPCPLLEVVKLGGQPKVAVLALMVGFGCHLQRRSARSDVTPGWESREEAAAAASSSRRQRLFEPAPVNCFARSPGWTGIRIGLGFGALGTSRVKMPFSNLAFIWSARTSPGRVSWRWKLPNAT